MIPFNSGICDYLAQGALDLRARRMRMANRCVSLLLLTLSCAGGILVTGCRSRGTVYISHPQVFTRERLVTARSKELQVLNQLLNTNVAFTLQGAQDVRTLDALQNSTALTFSPTAGANVSNATAPALSDASKLMPGGAASTMDLAKGIGVTAVDQFNTQMAYRDAVNAVIRERELDDTHDRHGRTLYTLKFDTALIPGRGVEEAALVKLFIQTHLPPSRPSY